MKHGSVRPSRPPEASVQAHPVSLRDGTALDLWVDLLAEIIVAEVLREPQAQPIETAPDTV